MSLTSIADLAKCRRIVVKIGSALLVEAGQPRREWLASLASDVADLKSQGIEVVIVSSGAIALGAARLGLPNGGRGSLADAQAAASVGQVELARLWAEAFARHDIIAAQILVSIGDLEDRRRYLNASATLARLIETGAVPVVNENDSVATEEIRFGDNDRLAARVAQAADAEAVLLLSDVDGLYDRDPRLEGASLIERVEGVTEDVMAMADSTSGSGLGTGGMLAKLQAAQIAERAGISLVIINGTKPSPLSEAVASGRGTIFLPQRGASAREAWLSGRLAPAGKLVVDDGCAKALVSSGASVLAVGVTSVEGCFQRGDLVEICGADGKRLAQGLSEYDAVSCRRIAGLREDQQAKVLGHAPRAAVVHRDHMVLA